MPTPWSKVQPELLAVTLAFVVTLDTDAATHTLSANASTAVAIDANYMVVGDDEDQILRIYDRRVDGPPIYQKDFTPNLGLTDLSPSGTIREVDIEASVRIGNRIYWLGSHGNCGGCDPPGELRPNRQRLFATDIAGTGAGATLSYVGRYDNLRRDLIAWDNTNGHRLGARFLQLAASAAEGVPPETAARDGFNIEALCMAPTGAVAYIGFRSPLTPSSGRTNALIVPLLNLPQLVLGNPAPGPARFDQPIEMFLDRRGFRSLDSSSNGVVIVAGTTTNSGTFRLYTWSGAAGPPAYERQASFTVNQPEGLIVEQPIATGAQVQLISEGGGDFKSQFVTLGPAIPELRGTLMAQSSFRFLIVGRPGGSYDVEAAEIGAPWGYISTVVIPPAGQTYWTNYNLPPNSRRLYRIRYPSRY
ncbi:MAG: hypothetical protein L0Y58_15215 [Verrucomicrobia subdivision 3 bacterium]|nr:hypothetical protein [Limisphaerales bacterium]